MGTRGSGQEGRNGQCIHVSIFSNGCWAPGLGSGGRIAGVTGNPRATPPMNTDERTTLEAWLDFPRDTLLLNCDGLPEPQLRLASVPPSPLSLQGLVQHMAEVERNWF